MVRSSTWPGPGAGGEYSSMRKSDGLGSPTGREARTTRFAGWDIVSSDFLLFVIASVAKQSILAKEKWIASSRSLSSGAHSRDPLAPRNDGLGKLARV